MRTSRAVVLAFAALAMVAAVSATSKGTTLRGYTFSTNVDAYLNITRDIYAIRQALNQKKPNYKLAQAIYMDGMNALLPDNGGLLSLRSIATGVKQPLPFWTQYSNYYGSNVWLDDTVQRAFGGLKPYTTDVQRVQLIVKTLESNLQVAFVLNQLDIAIAALKAKEPEAATAALDKAWAVYVGGEAQYGLWTVSLKRAGEFGTKVTCDKSQVSSKILEAFLNAQKAIKAGDDKALIAASGVVQAQLTANYVQAIITYAHEMWLDKAANISEAEHQTEAYAFFRTIEPLIAAANATSAQALMYWLFPGQPSTPDVDLKVARALSSAYKGLGITADDIGTFGKNQTELKCKAYTGDQGGILSTTKVTGPLRPATPAAAPKAAAPKAAAKPATPAAPAKTAAAATKPAMGGMAMDGKAKK